MTTATDKVNLLGLTQPQLESFFESIGEKRFRAGQVMKWIHHFGIDDFDAMSNLGKALKEKLAELRKGAQAPKAEGEKKPDLVRIGEGKTLHVGMKDPRVAQLRKRLDVAGDKNNPLYDDAVRDAVKTFQTQADIETIRWWSEITVVPCVAIGGITLANAPPLIAAGADFLAVSSGVWEHPDGAAAAVKAFNALF